MTSLEPIRESDYGIFCRMLDGRMGRERVFWYTPIKTKKKMLLLLCAISHPPSEQMVCFSIICESVYRPTHSFLITAIDWKLQLMGWIR